MNQSFDQAGELEARKLPVPPESRLFVFLPGRGADDKRMQLEWVKWGGKTEFVHEGHRRAECGICLFRKGDSLLEPGQAAQLVRPFFEEHGDEANVFEYDPKANKFLRINNEWLKTYYEAPVQN